MASWLLILLLSMLLARLSALTLILCLVLRVLLTLRTLATLLLVLGSLPSFASTSRVVILRPLPPVLLSGRLVGLLLPAAASAASFAAVLCGLPPVTRLVDRELVVTSIFAGSLAAAPTRIRSPTAGLPAARAAGRTVPTVAAGLLAPSASLAPPV